MKHIPMLTAILLTTVSMAAQAGQASVLTQQLNEPLAPYVQGTAGQAWSDVPVAERLEQGGSSAAMAKARARLAAHHRQVTDIELTGDPLTPAREATT